MTVAASPEGKHWRPVAIALGLLVTVVAVWLTFQLLGEEDTEGTGLAVPTEDPSVPQMAEEGPGETTAPSDSRDEEANPTTTSETPGNSAPATTTNSSAPDAPTTTAKIASEDNDPEPRTAAAEPPRTSAAPSSSPAATTETDEPSGGGASTTAVAEPIPFETLPDGSPVPVLARFDTDRIVLTGSVPSKGAKERLEVLAIANAKPGQAETINNRLTINPAVPTGVGVRVVELTSARFPTSSAEVLDLHALELDRAVGIMDALPHVSALVIGHSDQRGDDATNLAVSQARAQAVVEYMAAQGVSPDRLASRAVGEQDLLTLNDDEAALALNRRTEFVFYGLLNE